MVAHKNNTPIIDRPSLGVNLRSSQPPIIKEIFKICPICNRYSFKPNYNLRLMPDPKSLYAVVAVKGRRCRLCNFTSEPLIKK